MLDRFSRLVSYVPEPFTLSMILSLIAFAASYSVGAQSLPELSQIWLKGLWSIINFSMQMVFCLATGFALAQSPWIAARLKKLCTLPKNYAQAVALTAFISLLLGSLHWGLAIAGGSLLVRSMIRENRNGPAGLLGAAGYLPLMIWHGGLSGSAPLLMSTDGHFMFAETGLIGLDQTIGHSSNLILMLILLLLLPAVCFYWGKKFSGSNEAIEVEYEEEALPRDGSLWPGLLLGFAGLVLTFSWIQGIGFSKIGLNQINAGFLFLSLLFHGRFSSFLAAFKNGVLSSWSIVLLFPFYGAIMAIVKESGLAALLSQNLAEIATAATLPFYTFLSAGLLNIFIPSGGGQWVVQGPIVVSAGKSLGLSPELMVMAVAYGDQITNMLQPFWALPLLGIAKISASSLLRFTIPLMFIGGSLMALTLYLRT